MYQEPRVINEDNAHTLRIGDKFTCQRYLLDLTARGCIEEQAKDVLKVMNEPSCKHCEIGRVLRDAT